MLNNEIILNNTSRVFRVARKVVGLTQVEVAKSIGISQSSVSKYEAGILQPSALDWFNFCTLVNIDSTKAIKDGYVDNCTRIKDSFYKDMSFTVPKRYTANRVLKVREFLPLLAQYRSQFGEGGVEKVLAELRMDPDYFFVFDAPLSINFLQDFFALLPGTGKSFLDQAAKCAGNLLLHGDLKVQYQSASFAPNVGLAYIKKSPYYEDVFDHEQAFKGNKQTFIITPKAEMMEQIQNAQFWNSYTHFKIESLRNFIVMNSRNQEIPQPINTTKGRGLEVRLSA